MNDLSKNHAVMDDFEMPDDLISYDGFHCLRYVGCQAHWPIVTWL